jgi:hypothetical protein
LYTIVDACYQVVFIILFKVAEMKYMILVLVVFLVTVVGCAGSPTSSLAYQCDSGLTVAQRELDYAKAKGFSGTVEYAKAASLIGAAKIQKEFGKYPNCVDKVRRARAYIRMSQN